MLMIKDSRYSNHKTCGPVGPSTKTEAQTLLFLTWSLSWYFGKWEMREICYLTFDPIVLLNVFPQFESNLIYGLPSNRINKAPTSSVCFPLQIETSFIIDSRHQLSLCCLHSVSNSSLQGQKRHRPIMLPVDCINDWCVSAGKDGLWALTKMLFMGNIT